MTRLTNDSQVSRYEEGSAAARLWLGMGGDSSYFDALVESIKASMQDQTIRHGSVRQPFGWPRSGGTHAIGPQNSPASALKADLKSAHWATDGRGLRK